MRKSTLLAVIMIIAAVCLSVVAYIQWVRPLTTNIQFSSANSEKFVDYYLDVTGLVITVDKPTQQIVFAKGSEKIVFNNQTYFPQFAKTVDLWPKLTETEFGYTTIVPPGCSSLLLRYKFLDYTQLVTVGCDSNKVYSELKF